jgi:hypothetical protein
MGFNAGIIGLPNVGKTTIFNAITGADAEVTAYPFSNVKTDSRTVFVPDNRIEEIQKVIKADKLVYTTMEVVDVPALAQGASKGEGLGNRFLSDIQKLDALLHVVRCFDDENVMHIDEKIDPVRDIEIVNGELILADLESITNQLERLQKKVRANDKDAIKRTEILTKFQDHLFEEKPLSEMEITEEDQKFTKDMNLITLKPMLYVANIPEDAINNDNDYVKALEEYANKEGRKLIRISGQIEADIAMIEDEDEKSEFLEEMGLKEPGLYQLLREGYTLLNLITFFTVGGKENRAWTIRKNSTAWVSAGKIHSDIQRGFIRAEVYHYQDLITFKTESAVKDNGKFRLEGKEYLVKDGDVLHFRFNV